MRICKISLAGSTVECKITWRVMKAITDQVADPVLLAQEIHRQVTADADGRDYTPKVSLDTNACVKMLSIASGRDEDEIGELFMEHGLITAQEQAGIFLAHLLGAAQENSTPGKTEAPTKP